MLSRGKAAGPVGGADRGDVRLGLVGGIDDDEVDTAAAQLVLLLRLEVGEHQDHAHRPAAQHAVDPGVPGAVAVAALGQDQADPGLTRDALDAADDLDRPLALELVEHELDHLRAAAGRARGAAQVAVAVQQLLDAGPRHGGDIGAAVEDFRNRCERNPCL